MVCLGFECGSSYYTGSST